MALCDTCMGFEWELLTQIERPPGGFSKAEYWTDSKIDIPGPDWEIGGSTLRTLREQYDLAPKRPEKQDDTLKNLADELSVKKVEAAWGALVEAFGEERAMEAKKFYDVQAIPQEVQIQDNDGTVRVDIQYGIIIKPKLQVTRPQTEAPVILCEACDHGIHQYHMESSKSEPCECVLCEMDGEN